MTDLQRMNHDGNTITNLVEMVERVEPKVELCGHCYNYGEVAEELGWPTFDYKVVPCPYCPAGEKVAQELVEMAEQSTFTAWGAIAIGLLFSIPLWVLLAHEVQKGLWR